MPLPNYGLSMARRNSEVTTHCQTSTELVGFTIVLLELPVVCMIPKMKIIPKKHMNRVSNYRK